MKFYEKFSIRLFQKFPERIFPNSFKNYCMKIAERELASAKQELIRKKWQQANLECSLSKLRSKK